GDNDASTSQGSVTFAAAVAVSDVGGRTAAYIDSAGGADADADADPGHAVTGGTLNVSATSSDAASAIADGHYSDGSAGSSLAVGVGVAINNVDLFDEAWLGGSASLKAANVNVTAAMDADDTFTAQATSGAGGA